MASVCHVIFNHSPFDGRVFYKECCSLSKAGYSVTILAPSVDRKTLGKKKDALLGKDKTFQKNGVTFTYYYHNKKLPNIFGMRKRSTINAILRKLVEINADFYHFHEEGILFEVAGRLKKVMPDKKLIVDYHECYPNLYRFNDKRVKKIAGFFKQENRVLRDADLLICVSDTLNDYYRALTKAPVVTIMNCQSEKIFTNTSQAQSKDKTFWVVHEGRMLFNRGLKALIEVAGHVRVPEIKFLLIGDMPERENRYFEEMVADYQIQDKFHITGFLPYLEVPEWLSKASIGLHFMLSRNGYCTISNKFFNYLRFGLPIISLPHPIVGEIIEKHTLGYIFSENEPQSIARQIEELYSNRSLRQKVSGNVAKAFQSTFNWEKMEERLLKAYNTLV